jgi:CheY-like chemotaxis protein
MPDLVGHSYPSPPDDSADSQIPKANEGVDFTAAVTHRTLPTATLPDHQPPYILLITDDRGFGQQVTAALDRLGYRTAMIQTADPAVATSRCASERPDLVLLNIDALSLGGIGLSRRLKGDTPGLRVLTLVHSHELEAAREEAAISGADAVYGLLDLPMQLGEVVKDLIERKALESEKAPIEPARSLQDRIRTEAKAFDFSALLDGVAAQPAQPTPTAPEFESNSPDHPWLDEKELRHGLPLPVKSPGRRRLKPVLFALAGIAAVAVPIYLLNSGLMQPAGEVNAISTAPSTPDINLTARKGMPYRPLTPGERSDQPQPDGDIPKDAQEKVFAAYGMTPTVAQQYVVVRLIPAGIGGTVDPWNLFPTTPWFADLKSRLDKKLVDLVASGQMTAAQAEVELKDDWVKASHRYYIRNYGIQNPNDAREKENSLKW